MNRKKIIFIITCLILTIGVVGFIIWNNRIVSTITLDINPSIEINLDRKERVINITALNEDARDIVNNEYNNKTLDDVFELLIINLLDKGYDNHDIDVILYADGEVKDEDVAKKVEFIFGKRDVHTEVIVVEKITKEDKNLAKKYNISPAKASYIKSIIKDNENINIEYLTNKSVNELKETKYTGNYCDDGSILEGDWCLIEINHIPATNGDVCPRGYLEYEEKCYEEEGFIEGNNYICRDDFILDNNKCIREKIEDAKPNKYSCANGTSKTRAEAGLTDMNSGDANNIVCVDASNATHPMSPCEVNDGTEYLMSGGKCYWHRAPIIESGCPGKIQVGGYCWDDASSILICVGARDGKQYSSRSEYCEGSVKYTDPIVSEYKCENKDAILRNNKCVVKEIEDAQKEKHCPEGYSLVNNDRCINYNKISNKESGLICEGENTKLKGNTCIVYDRVEAKHN